MELYYENKFWVINGITNNLLNLKILLFVYFLLAIRLLSSITTDTTNIMKKLQSALDKI